jgi:hypothetical protein
MLSRRMATKVIPQTTTTTTTAAPTTTTPAPVTEIVTAVRRDALWDSTLTTRYNQFSINTAGWYFLALNSSFNYTGGFWILRLLNGSGTTQLNVQTMGVVSSSGYWVELPTQVYLAANTNYLFGMTPSRGGNYGVSSTCPVSFGSGKVVTMKGQCYTDGPPFGITAIYPNGYIPMRIRW